MAAPRQLLVGLGNPGTQYARNRHNIGFMAVERIATRYGIGPFRARFRGEVAAGEIAGCPVLLLRPLTFMNESGRSVREAAQFHKLAVGDVIVFHDELDLAAGKLRVKRGGGAAGHNGLRSIDTHLGADYWRVRLGIGHPGDRNRVLGHVLNDFSSADQAWLDPLLDEVAAQLPLMLSGDAAAFASKVAVALSPPRPKPPRKGASGDDDGEKAKSVGKAVTPAKNNH